MTVNARRFNSGGSSRHSDPLSDHGDLAEGIVFDAPANPSEIARLEEAELLRNDDEKQSKAEE